MRILLSMRITQANSYDEPRDSLAQEWTSFIEPLDSVPIGMPNNLSNPSAFIQALQPDLIVLTGGDDPRIKDNRCQTEETLLSYATETRTPLLGVCRGMQFLNISLGGALRPVSGHVAQNHQVTIVEPWFKSIYGDHVVVNSFHDDGIATDDVAPSFDIAATFEGSVEAICHKSLPIAGIMWHPERADAPTADETLFSSLTALRKSS